MSIRIGSNIASLRGLRQLDLTSSSLNSVFERLASGQRILSASDDAAGLAIASSLEADKRVFNQALRNINDGISAINIAEGALGELSNITTRQIELAEQAANGVYSIEQRRALDEEAHALQKEYNRIIETTEFNGLYLLNDDSGSINIEAGYGAAASIDIAGSNDIKRSVGTGVFGADALATGPNVASGDFNGDGIIDLVSSTAGGARTRVSFGNGDGTFQAEVHITGSGTSNQYTVFDYDNDGDEDIVVGRYYSADIMILDNDGSGSFSVTTLSTQNTDTSVARAVSSADFNNDGYQDLVVAQVANTGTNDVEIFLNDGNGSFSQGDFISDVSGYNGGLTTGDINGDGHIDIATRGRFFLNDGSGNFDSVFEISNAFASGTADQLVDLNHDGYLDYIVARGGNAAGTDNFKYYLGNGDGTFGDQNIVFSSLSGTRFLRSEILDFNNDGFADVAFQDHMNSAVEIFINDGEGNLSSFTTATGTSSGSGVGIAVGDFNSDGAIDIANSAFANLATTEQKSSVEKMYLLTQEGAREALDKLNEQLDRVTASLGALGADASRLAIASNMLSVTSENFEAARSQIVDADIANDSAQAIRFTLLQNAGAAVLAQANQQPSIALALLST